MKKIILLTVQLLALSAAVVVAQNAEDEKAVKEVINRVFKAMELGDSAMLHTAFASSTTTATILRDKNNNVVLRREDSIADFLKAVGTPHKEVWYEEIWNVNVQLDGDFVQAWCDYAFYVDKTFSHCGADAFHLIKTKAGWKIFHLADTRRKSGCEIPQEIQDKHK
jgi:hypothetical protein